MKIITNILKAIGMTYVLILAMILGFVLVTNALIWAIAR